MSTSASRTLSTLNMLELHAVVSILWRSRYQIIVCALLAASISVAIAFWMTPIYRSTTVLAPTANDTDDLQSLISSSIAPLQGVAAVLGVDRMSASLQTLEALAILRSRQFTEDFIRDEHLMPVLFSDQWNLEEEKWVGDEKNWPTFAQGYKYFDETVRSVTMNSTTGLVSLAIEWKDPDTCALWANRLVKRLNDVMRTRAIQQAADSIGFLEQELRSTATVETRQSINRLIESQINDRMLANVMPEYAFRVVDPALPPDLRDIVRPNKTFIVILGFLVGAMIGITIALVRGASLVPSSSETETGVART